MLCQLSYASKLGKIVLRGNLRTICAGEKLYPYL